MTVQIDTLDSKEYIIIKGAKAHNLKNINVAIPRNKFVVITGVSGSGKSSLAFDTLYAEGQRRYVESLSAYARQFLGKIDKPEVEFIKGISPAIAIEQKVNTVNPRSTVGTSTEIYDYLKLLFARIGRTFSPVSGQEVKRDSIDDVVNYINSLDEGTKVMLFSPVKLNGRTLKKQLEVLQQQGFTRAKLNGEVQKIDELKSFKADTKKIDLLIDRFVVKHDDEYNSNRIADSVQTSFFEGDGECFVTIGNITRHFSNKFELDGIEFEKPSVHFFSFNNPLGACTACEGFGNVIGIDEDLVIPNKSLSVYDSAIVCWKGEKMSKWLQRLLTNAHQFDFPVHRPYHKLTQAQKELLWTGNQHFRGLNRFFKYLEEKSYKIQYRVMLSRYRGKTPCLECRGTRLRKDANHVKVGGKSITDIVLMPVKESLVFFRKIKLNEHEKGISKRLLIEILNRLQFLNDVGLGYLTLNRLSSTLSGGESQRINLATSLGSSLVGSMYILDEPSIGLHPRDTQQLIGVLQSLKQLGNTVIVVEHDEEIIQAADEVIDLGPLAGTLGGELVFQGNHKKILKEKESLTARYLTGINKILVPKKRRDWKDFIELKSARENNLKGFDVKFPLNAMTVVTGVSGSGKSSLVKKILYPTLKKLYGGYAEKTGAFDALAGSTEKISDVEFVDQNPIGRSSRSNPATYVKAYDEIRNLFTNQQLAKARGYKPAHFSFNVDGGRCEMCEGEGIIKVEMQFMADIRLQCEACKGKRFRDEILDVKFNEKNVDDILNMTIEDAVEFFSKSDDSIPKRIISKLKPLQDVGLGYAQLGQSSSTLSGGEAQRIKLASFLVKGSSAEKILFIFDEPTTGLHFHDINKLLSAFNALLGKGHSIIIIEHNPEIIKCADWVIDLGPEGGDEGGELVFEGTPEELAKCKKSHTGKFLKDKL
ncbi:MAG: excinuclease ABC subunit A [Flavobacteriales bacterium]|nr:MAG: excinuclease ABC subunit A [Flavobacteriales bacterium]